MPDDTPIGDMLAGDYCRVTWTSPPCWFVRDPRGAAGTIRTHTVKEHEDGTITVSPSIQSPDAGGWHGWLRRGVWSEA